MPVDSFAFRLACYEEFHWTPDTVKALTVAEAERLAIFFEESGAYQYRKRKEYESASGSPTGNSQDVEVVFGDDDEEDEDSWQPQTLE